MATWRRGVALDSEDFREHDPRNVFERDLGRLRRAVGRANEVLYDKSLTRRRADDEALGRRTREKNQENARKGVAVKQAQRATDAAVLLKHVLDCRARYPNLSRREIARQYLRKIRKDANLKAVNAAANRILRLENAKSV